MKLFLRSNNYMTKKLIRITTVPMALRYLLPGQMKFMQANGFDVLMISADGKELPQVIANENCRHIIVPLTRKITPLQDLKCLFRLIKIFKKEKPDIVHTHTPKAGLLGMLAAKICGIKIRIHTVAGLPLMVEKGFKFRLLKFIEKLTAWSATQVWPNSASLLNIIKENKLAKANKLKIIGKGSSNGIDTQRFNKDVLDEKQLIEIKGSITYSPDTIYLLSIGRMVADKGIPELVSVFSSLQQQQKNIQLILVGQYEPELDPLPVETIKQIESNPSICHINWTDKVEYYMAVATYFVFPSHREGFPNVLLQSGAMQLPIICSRIEGNVDLIVDGETGLLFEKGNEEQLKDRIEFAIIHKLYTTIQIDYRRENIWQNIFKEYQTLLNLNT
jgi:glycosyltransferase involved in cell wall biosynthesis